MLGLYVNERKVALINQTLETMTEFCQYRWHDNMGSIATQESNELDIITALLLTDRHKPAGPAAHHGSRSRGQKQRVKNASLKNRNNIMKVIPEIHIL